MTSAPRRLPLYGSSPEDELDAAPLARFAMADAAAAPRLAPADHGEIARVTPLLREVVRALRGAPGSASVFAINERTPGSLRALDELLGEGEVRAEVAGAASYRIVESTLPGLWRVQTHDRDGRLVGDHLEVADVPRVVRAAAASGARREVAIPDERDGLMNARPLLVELRHRAATWREGDRNHVVSLTLLPTTAGDLEAIARALGTGPVQAISRGYGTCHVALTACARVWIVQYLNAMGAPILDTLEVGDVPVALRAEPSDLRDSAARLEDLMGAYAS